MEEILNMSHNRRCCFQHVRISTNPDSWMFGFSDIRKTGSPDIRIFGYPEIRISGNPDLRISGFPDIWNSVYPELRISGFSKARMPISSILPSCLLEICIGPDFSHLFEIRTRKYGGNCLHTRKRRYVQVAPIATDISELHETL